MSTSERLTRIIGFAFNIQITDESKLILMGDCHRGDGGWSDDFARNQHLYYYALTHYDQRGFTYIELGDGDDLWENREFWRIRKTYDQIFNLLRSLYDKERFHLIAGNHDNERLDPKTTERTLFHYRDEHNGTILPLFPDIPVREAIKLTVAHSRNSILLVHGHQGSLIDDRWWRVGRFWVRHVWRPLQFLGVNDPTRPARNFRRREKVERRLTDWVRAHHQMLIAGHTHRPSFPPKGGAAYFNVGSCVHPRSITGLEIVKSTIRLVEWHEEPDARGFLRIVRRTISGPAKLMDYLKPPSCQRADVTPSYEECVGDPTILPRLARDE